MARQYYTLVAGLREISLEGDFNSFSARATIDQISEELSGSDLVALRLLYNFYDIENIINLRGERDRFSQLGVLTKQELEHGLSCTEELPKYIQTVLTAFDNPSSIDSEDVDTEKRFEHALFEAYYNECAKSKCSFIRSWAEFDRNLRNLTAAYTARMMTVEMESVIVGSGYVVDHLTRNSALDFGLKGELEYIDMVISTISDEPNLVEKERKIDGLKWQMADSLTTFDYFNINTILAYLVKVNIIYRWMSLDEQEGRLMLDKLIGSLSARGIIEQKEKDVN